MPRARFPALAAFLVLAACAETASVPEIPVPETPPGSGAQATQSEAPALAAPSAPAIPEPDNADVTVAKAALAFEDICLTEAPLFLASEERMARHGLTRAAQTGTRYHASGKMSAKIQSGRRADGVRVRRCSLVYEDPDSASGSFEIAGIVQRLGTALSGQRSADFSALGKTHRGTAWDISLGGQTGEMFHLPYRGPQQIGGFIVQFRGTN